LPMSASNFSSGIAPSSDCFVALTMTMNRMQTSVMILGYRNIGKVVWKPVSG
jgi:hypothetical protein